MRTGHHNHYIIISYNAKECAQNPKEKFRTRIFLSFYLEDHLHFSELDKFIQCLGAIQAKKKFNAKMLPRLRCLLRYVIF